MIYDFCGEGGRPGVDSYVHRIGRTGRAGRRGRSITFFGRDDAGAAALVDLLRAAEQEVPDELQALVEHDRTRESDRMLKKERNDERHGARNRQEERLAKRQKNRLAATLHAERHAECLDRHVS